MKEIFFISLCVIGQVFGLVPLTPEQILPAGVDSNVSVNPYTGDSCEARKGTIKANLLRN